MVSFIYKECVLKAKKFQRILITSVCSQRIELDWSLSKLPFTKRRHVELEKSDLWGVSLFLLSEKEHSSCSSSTRKIFVCVCLKCSMSQTLSSLREYFPDRDTYAQIFKVKLNFFFLNVRLISRLIITQFFSIILCFRCKTKDLMCI